jgi:elongation factor P
MNEETFEQIPLSTAALGDSVQYLVDNMSLNISSYEGEPIDIDLPTSVDLRVVEAPMALAGDTATGATKQVTLESGLKVTVPLFISEGDVIRVDTRTGDYLTRV